MREVACVALTSGFLKQILLEHLRLLQALRSGTLGKGAVSSLGGWALLGVVWLGLGLGVETLLIVSFSWARASTWQVSGTKLYSGLYSGLFFRLFQFAIKHRCPGSS